MHAYQAKPLVGSGNKRKLEKAADWDKSRGDVQPDSGCKGSSGPADLYGAPVGRQLVCRRCFWSWGWERHMLNECIFGASCHNLCMQHCSLTHPCPFSSAPWYPYTKLATPVGPLCMLECSATWGVLQGSSWVLAQGLPQAAGGHGRGGRAWPSHGAMQGQGGGVRGRSVRAGLCRAGGAAVPQREQEASGIVKG